MAYRKLSANGRPPSSGPLLARAVLAETVERYGSVDPEGQSDGFHLDPGAAAVCAVVAQHRNPASAAAIDASADLAPETANGLAYGIMPAALEQATTPAAMLLAVRQAHRNSAR